MRKENSYGIIPLRFKKNHWEVLLVQHQSGYWSFPKGHAEPGETPRQAAERELKEETGLRIHSFLSLDPMIENYWFFFKGDRINKTVQFFPALVEGRVVIQEEELVSSKWGPLSEAHHKITYKEGRHLCQQVVDFLKSVIPPTTDLAGA